MSPGLPPGKAADSRSPRRQELHHRRPVRVFKPDRVSARRANPPPLPPQQCDMRRPRWRRRLTLWESFGCVRLTLWDERQRQLISFREMRALYR